MIGEIHCHTNLSLPHWAHRNLATPKELVDRAISIGLDFVAITDHDTQTAFSEINVYALQNGLVLIPSVEITVKASRLPNKRPHVLAYGVPEKIHSRLPIDETIDLIHVQGGLAVAAHPYGVKFSKVTFMGTDLIMNNNFDGIEVFNSYEDELANRRAYTVAVEKKSLMFGGSDAHSIDHLGLTKIIVDIPKTKNWQDILEAIRVGKFSISTKQSLGGSKTRKRLSSTSMSILLSSLKGKAA